MLAHLRTAYLPLPTTASPSPTSTPTPTTASTWLPQRFATKRRALLLGLAALVLAVLLLVRHGSRGSARLVSVNAHRHEPVIVIPATARQVEQDGFPPAPVDCNNALTVTYRLRADDLRFAPTTDWISPSPALPRSASLNERLDAWLDAPIGSRATQLAFNSLTCANPSVRREQNQLHFRNNLNFWNAIDEERIRTLRQEAVAVLRNAQREGRVSDAARHASDPDKQGIVWTAGNAVRACPNTALVLPTGTTRLTTYPPGHL